LPAKPFVDFIDVKKQPLLIYQFKLIKVI
jgi:hypothetical protein